MLVDAETYLTRSHSLTISVRSLMAPVSGSGADSRSSPIVMTET